MTYQPKIYSISHLLIIVLIFVYSNNSLANNGITLESTRIIYNSSDKNGITFNVINNTNKNYLLQSRVLMLEKNEILPLKLVDENRSNNINSSEYFEELVPFIVLPPITRFDSGDILTLNIRLTENILPKDRESLYEFTIKAIPSQSTLDAHIQSSLVLALQNNLKLFYRPKEIIILDSNSRAESLKFHYEKKVLSIENPTPYYITLSGLNVDDINILMDVKTVMIDPYSFVEFHIIENAKVISWMILDDTGLNTEIKYRKID